MVEPATKRLRLEGGSAASSTATIVDKDGDLVLVVGTAKHRVRVASKALTSTSGVFKAMLSGQFKEAAELAASSAIGELYELPLPDDDVEAMIAICNIVHLRPKEVPSIKTFSASLLQNIVFLAEKYDCEVPVALVMEPWLGTIVENILDLWGKEGSASSGWKQLLLVCYVWSDSDTFTRLANELCLSYKHDFKLLQAADDSYRMPDRIFEILETGRRDAFDYATAEITEVVDNLSMGAPCASTHGRSPDQYSQHDTIRLGDLVKQLRDKKLWPNRLWTDPPLDFSLNEVCSALSTIRDTSIVIGSDDNCNACSLGSSLQSEMEDLVSDIQDATRELKFCLPCANMDGTGDFCKTHQPLLPTF